MLLSTSSPPVDPAATQPLPSSATTKADRMQLHACCSPKLNCLAKALYDNVAEAPDELAFRKGDVLTVLEQNTNGLEGWWLCSLRGRQGIAPGNRLRLLPGMYDPTGLGYAGALGTIATTTGTGGGQAPAGPDQNSHHARRRSWHTNPNKVITPQKIGDVYLYDVPVSSRMVEPYDVPPQQRPPLSGPIPIPAGSLIAALKTGQGAYDEPKPHALAYDVPRPAQSAYDEPRSNAPVICDVTSCGTTNDPVKVNDYDMPNANAYDVPAAPPRLVIPVSSSLTTGTYDIPIPYQQHLPVIPDGLVHLQGTHTRSASGTYVVPTSKRSSGVSVLSTSSSSALSPSSSQSSLNTSLSLSSLCGSNRSSLEKQPHELYDIPPPGSHQRVLMDHAFISSKCGGIRDVYDIPLNNAPAGQFYDTPPAPRPALSHPAPQGVGEGVYDIPPQVTRDVGLLSVGEESTTDSGNTDRRLSSSSTDSREFRENFPDIEGKELPLDLDAAMELLVKDHQAVQSAITKLFSFISATWRKRDIMESKLYDIEVTCHKLRDALGEFVDFVHGALANSTHSSDRSLCHKLGKLVKPLVNSNTIVRSTVQSLDDKGWQITRLATAEDDASSTPDELDQLVACARGLVEDVRQVASFIQGNCTLIFKRASLLIPKGNSTDTIGKQGLQDRPLPAPPGKKPPPGVIPTDIGIKEGVNDYDYVNLESREAVERENEEIKAALPKQLHKSFENLVKQSQVPVDNDMSKFSVRTQEGGTLDPNELQVLQFYSAQVETHALFLTNAIDAFLQTIENNQPPKVFIGHSKFVIISAHKLVYIGDTVLRNIFHQDVKNQVMQCSNSLYDSLKSLVMSTKKAALQFPSVVAVQEMVDSVVDVSHLAKDLKTVVAQTAQL